MKNPAASSGASDRTGQTIAASCGELTPQRLKNPDSRKPSLSKLAWSGQKDKNWVSINDVPGWGGAINAHRVKYCYLLRFANYSDFFLRQLPK